MAFLVRPDVKVFPGTDALAEYASEVFLDAARAAIRERGVFNASLSGGLTPKRLYEILGQESGVDWDSTHLFWSDERRSGSEESNFTMAEKALVSKIIIPARNVHRIKGELSPQDAASDYESELKSHFNGFPLFDLMLLGMGSDGHTASIFPGTDAVSERERLALPVHVPRLDSWRVTLTLPVINASRLIVFMITGKTKAGVLREVIGGNPEYPASLVRPDKGRLLFLLDKEASSML